MFENWEEFWDCYKFLMQYSALIALSMFTIFFIGISIVFLVKFIGGF